MSDFTGLGDLVQEIRATSRSIEQGDAVNKAALEELQAKQKSLERSLDELYRRTGRQGAAEYKDARDFCILKHCADVPKDRGIEDAYEPSPTHINEALLAKKAFTKVLRHGDPNKLDPAERKSLSSFSFGTNNFILSPERSNIVMSCLVDPSDLSGLVSTVTTSAPSIKFLIDNARMGVGAWSCESSCFANNPSPDLQEGLGELEIKPETIRMVVCATGDLLEDAAFDLESWLFEKIATGMRATINHALLLGDGIGKPLGLLNPKSGVPICETSAATGRALLAGRI